MYFFFALSNAIEDNNRCMSTVQWPLDIIEITLEPQGRGEIKFSRFVTSLFVKRIFHITPANISNT